MTFYLKPPDGSIPSYKFEQFAENRFRFLLALLDNPDKNLSEIVQISRLRSSQLDCLVHGTPKDRVSHFALRTSTMTNFTLQRVIQEGERLLFEKRFQSMTVAEIENSIKSFARHLRDFQPFFAAVFKKNDYTQYTDVTYRTMLKILSSKLLQCGSTSASSCESKSATDALCPVHQNAHILEVPFTHILELVSNRTVNLDHGTAHLTCAQLPVYLGSVFSRILECSSYTMRKSTVLRKCFEEESRFFNIFKQLKSIFQRHRQCGTLLEGNADNWIISSRLLPANNKITLSTLDFEACQFFPPCMRTHFTTLRRTHRLPHAARFQFTLFLKDIGLPVDDCISLLKQEYSKSICDAEPSTPPSSQSSISSVGSSPGKCSHSWDKDKNRYIYGTRHMYGLEGARRDYSSHSCESIIKNGCGDGCPFVGCNQNELFQRNLEIDLESQQLENRVPEFLSSLKNEMNVPPIESCHVYLNLKRQKLSGRASASAGDSGSSAVAQYFAKPSHFYLKLKRDAT